jgi:hypothetical protein
MVSWGNRAREYIQLANCRNKQSQSTFNCQLKKQVESEYIQMSAEETSRVRIRSTVSWRNKQSQNTFNCQLKKQAESEYSTFKCQLKKKAESEYIQLSAEETSGVRIYSTVQLSAEETSRARMQLFRPKLEYNRWAKETKREIVQLVTEETKPEYHWLAEETNKGEEQNQSTTGSWRKKQKWRNKTRLPLVSGRNKHSKSTYNWSAKKQTE